MQANDRACCRDDIASLVLGGKAVSTR